MNLKFKVGLAVAIILLGMLAVFWWPAGKSAEAAPIAVQAAAPHALQAENPSVTSSPSSRPAAVALPVVPPAMPAAVVVVATPKAADDTATAPTDDPATQLAAASTLSATWVSQDPQAFTNWLDGLPAGDVRDMAIQQLVSSSQATKNPTVVLQWVNTVSNPQLKAGLLQKLGQN